MRQISVIVPVYNNPDGLEKVLFSLVNQSYSQDDYEIIIVDNNSSIDRTREVALEYRNKYSELVQLVNENSLQGSYATRNTGIKQSQGEIVAMVDADCIPAQDWIMNGVKSLETLKADLVGGQVEFFFSDNPSPAEMYDSMVHMQVKKSIETKGVSPTANLFVRRDVFDAMGLFPSHLSSGGDVIWTGAATRAGFILRFASEAKVFHPARGFKHLIKKKIRVASGFFPIRRSKNISPLAVMKDMLRYLFPPRIRHIRNLIRERGDPDMYQYLWSIWFVAWVCRYATNLGRILPISKMVKE